MLRIVTFSRNDDDTLSICEIVEPLPKYRAEFSRRAFHQFRRGEIARIDMGDASKPISTYRTVAA